MQLMGSCQLNAVVAAQAKSLGKYTSFFDQRLGDIRDRKARPSLLKHGSSLGYSRLTSTLETSALGKGSHRLSPGDPADRDSF